MTVKYQLETRTGSRAGSGTNAGVHVTVQFERGRAGPAKLDRFLHDDFRVGATDSFDVEAPGDLGEPIALLFKLDVKEDGWLTDWYLAEARLRLGAREWVFPANAWVRGGAERIVFEGRARLPQHATRMGERELRDREVAERRVTLPWRPNDGSLPGSLDVGKHRPLPHDEEYRGLGEGNYQVVFAKTMAALKLTSLALKSVFDRFDDFLDLLSDDAVPPVARHWTEDREAGRQPVQGISPCFLRLARQVPDGMPLPPSEAAFHLEPGIDLERAFAERRIFEVDFAVLEGIPLFHKVDEHGTEERRYAPPARALYFREAVGTLRPIAIQLGRDPARCPVFTPSDSREDWLAAKAYLACAEGNVHQIVSHAMRTHFVMEPFVMATLRNLSSAHPVYKLLKRHTRYTLAINEGARESLLAPGGVFDLFMASGGPDQGHLQLFARTYAKWTLADNRLPDDLARRGVADPSVLPYYPYRDDALPIWDSIAACVREMLAIYYRDDAELRADDEMMAWWEDLVDRGLPVEKLPCAKLERVADLADLLTTFVFTVSAQHAAVNYLQYEHYAFVPNAPLCMRRPPPSEKGTLDEAGLVASMPDRTQSSWQVAIGKALASMGTDEQFLHMEAGWDDRWFTDPEAVEVLERFQRRMALQAGRVEEMNARRPEPYRILHPGRVPASITI